MILDWEFGDITTWVSVGDCKPFPVNIYKKDDEWRWQAHKDTMTDQERIAVEGHTKNVIAMMTTMWKPNTKRRLNWDTTRLKGKKPK